MSISKTMISSQFWKQVQYNSLINIEYYEYIHISTESGIESVANINLW